jgi:uncharacterized protein Yka (UPF0111/DUF47 family)
MPKEEQFFPLFKQHADRLANAAGTLKSLLDGGAQTSRYCEELNRIEKDADKSARKVLDAVRSTFVTPFNRVDIKSLISEMDGCLQNMRKTGRAASLFAFDRFEPCMQEIGDVIVESAALVKRHLQMADVAAAFAFRLFLADQVAAPLLHRHGVVDACPRLLRCVGRSRQRNERDHQHDRPHLDLPGLI